MEEEKSNNRCYLPPASPTPWLIYAHGHGRRKQMQTFCTISSSPPCTQYYYKSIPELRGKEILFSNNDGWILLLDRNNMLTLWNPVASRLINLPMLEPLEDGVLISCAFIYSCKDGDGRDNLSVLVFAEGEAFSFLPYRNNHRWTAQNTNLFGHRATVYRAINCNGVIYGDVRAAPENNGDRFYFVTIELNDTSSNFVADGPLTLRPLHEDVVDAGFFYVGNVRYLLECSGQVYKVQIHTRHCEDRRICAVSVWKLNSSLMEWVRVKSLDGRAFFLGRMSCSWCWGNSDHHYESGGVVQNSVYFEVADDVGIPEALYMYDLNDCSLTSLLPCPNLPSPWYKPTWVITSQYQRSAKHKSQKDGGEKSSILKQSSRAAQYGGRQEQDVICHTLDRLKQGVMLDKFPLPDLPLDCMFSVARRLHLFDYMSFRATCKLFKSVTPVAGWRTNNSYPLLLFFESEEPLCRLMDPCRSDPCYLVLPKLFGGIVHVDFSKNGWLILRTNGGKSLQYLNPFTRVRGEFPHHESMLDFTSVGFSSHPTSSDCVTVGITFYGGFRIYYHRFGDCSWHYIDFEQDLYAFLPGVGGPVYYDGAFYFLDRRGYLGVCELSDDDDDYYDGYWDIYDKPQELRDNDTIHSSHLVECDGDLLSVFIGDMGKPFRVFKFDMKRMKWVRVKSLGNHVLFLGPLSSLSVTTTEHEMRNRIYLSRQRGDGILYYDLYTGKYGTLMGEVSESLSGTKEFLRCCWI